MNIDTLTRWIRAALNILLLKHPSRTSVALLFGPSADFLLDLFKPVLSPVPWLNLNAITPLRLSILAVAIVHLPLAFGSKRMPEELEAKFSTVGRAIKDGGISPVQARLLYHKIALDALAEARIGKAASNSDGDGIAI